MKLKLPLIASALTMSTICAQSAFGQAIPPLPQHPQQDENGVDLASWSSSLTWDAMSIGTPEQGGLNFQMFVLNEGNGTIRNSYTADLTFTDYDMASAIATFGGHTAQFGLYPETPGEAIINAYTYVMRDGTRIDFDCYRIGSLCAGQSGSPVFFFPTKLTKPNGEILTYYNKVMGPIDVRIQSIKSNRGYQIKYEYLTNTYTTYSQSYNWKVVTKITLVNNAYQFCDPDADNCSLQSQWPNVTIGRSAYGQLTYVHDSSGVGYDFDSNGIKPPGSNYYIKYTGEYYQDMNLAYKWRIRTAVKDGKTWQYNYTPDGAWFNYLTVTAPDGSASQFRVMSGYSLDLQSLSPTIVSYKNQVQNTSTYAYNTSQLIKEVHAPEGNWQEFAYDDRGNVTQSTWHAKPGSGLADITTLASYPSPGAWCISATCNKPISTTDALGRVTDFVWSSVHGGKLSEMMPAPSAGAPRPLKLYTYVTKSAYVLNSANALVSTGQPVWLPETETVCQTTAGSSSATCDPNAPQTVTTYLYGADGTPDNLLIRGKTVTSGATSLLTCYRYDKLSRKISETAPNANLASCP